MKNEEVLHRVTKDKNILHTRRRRESNWIGHVLLWKCLSKHVIQGKIEEGIGMKRRRGRRRRHLLDDLKKTRYYWKLRAEIPDRTLWKSHFERGCGRVVRLYEVNNNLFAEGHDLETSNYQISSPKAQFLGRQVWKIWRDLNGCFTTAYQIIYKLG
jgi:hypothetical protein